MAASVSFDEIQRGDFLLSHGCAFKVTRLTETGFKFDCVNGGWSGAYHRDTGCVQVDGKTEKWSASIERRASPTAALDGMHYNELIPWLEANA